MKTDSSIFLLSLSCALSMRVRNKSTYHGALEGKGAVWVPECSGSTARTHVRVSRQVDFFHLYDLCPKSIRSLRVLHAEISTEVGRGLATLTNDGTCGHY